MGKRVNDPSRCCQQNHHLVEWVEIKSIKEAGFSDVYDLEVWPYHNFVASGIVIHNCNAHCSFCAAVYQTGERASIPTERIKLFLEDAAEIGVRGMAIMSDGESTLHPFWAESIRYGKSLGMDMAAASNGYRLTPELVDKVLPHLTYLRINFSAGEPKRYAEIMGVPESWYHRVKANIAHMVAEKRKHGYEVTLNMNMVCRPRDADQILPFTWLAKELGVDYCIIKHCMDYEGKIEGVSADGYERLVPLLAEAESLSGDGFLVIAKHRMMEMRGYDAPPYCYGPNFLLQMSGTGLIGACGPLFGPQWAERYHIGNICDIRFKDLWASDRYMGVMNYLRSEHFAERRPCRRYLCVQRHMNEALDAHLRGIAPLGKITEPPPEHVNFV